MSEHQHIDERIIERHCDVAVIGGSAAGLAAALQLARQRRCVIVVDAGEPRNAPAAHMHSYLGHEGIAPASFHAIAREEVRTYGVEVLDGRAVEVAGDVEHGFRLVLAGGHAVRARRVLVATGIVDELPAIDGLAAHWGREVIHCPFCHGYEVRDRRIVQIVTHPMNLHTAVLFRQLSEHLTLVLHDGVEVDHPDLGALRRAGVRVVDDRVARVLSAADGCVDSIELGSGETIDADVVVVGTRFHPRVDALSSLAVEIVEHTSGLGDVVAVDPSGATSVTGIHAAGNVTDPSQQVLAAAAHGSLVGAMIGAGLAHDDLGAAARVSANQADWDHRYGGDPIWSGNPNGSLVRAVADLAAGRALDVGAGEGGDAIWLAEQGWEVTATDISRHAVDRIAAAAMERELSVACLHADANDVAPFESGAFDLVTAHYASIPRTPDRRGIHNLLDAVAVGGVLLVVGHDLEPMRGPIDTTQRSRAFDVDAYVRVDDVVAVIATSEDWCIDVHEQRPRPAGHAAASRHVDDIVLRAHRVSRSVDG
jgi:thioredoxin reductase/SAM-dependent methyltransferase